MLNGQTVTFLSNLFFWRKVYAGSALKFAIPIGLQDLKVKRVEERTTKHGKRMVEVKIYKDPSEEMYGENVLRVLGEEKISFAPIRCFHVEGVGTSRDFFRRFTTMRPTELDKLADLKGMSFKGLVKHYAEDSITHGHLNRNDDGTRKKIWNHEILATCDVNETIDFDYFDLVDFGVQDRIKLKTYDEEIPF